MTETSSASGSGRGPIKYAHGALDRAATLREDAGWLERALDDRRTRLVAVWRDQSRVTELEGRQPAAVLHGADLHSHASERVFLGLHGEVALFAADYSHLDMDEAHDLLGDPFADLRRVGPLLTDHDAALLAYARGMLYWHRNHQFCARCGARAESRRGGHLRVCSNADCRRSAFPRTDPAVIMLVEHPGGDGGPPRCLLGRSRHFPPGVYSTLAGFVEPGESMEQTVRREVFEESGVEVGDVRYLASQPWPFPSSLMLGFHATATSTEIRPQDDELEDVRWFTAEELRIAKDWGDDAPLCLPRRDSIARFLIGQWLRRHDGSV